MNILERLILHIAKNKIEKVTPKPDLLKIYQDYLPILEKYYEEAFYWHGTGRYHYKLKGNSKYEGVNQEEVYDVLQSIINVAGLQPKFDPFIKVKGKLTKTISLTKYRMYARAYAEFNLPTDVCFQYTYGSTKFWFYFLGILQLITNNFVLNVFQALRMHYSNSYKEFAAPWTDTFRKKGKKWSVFDFYNLRSDITTNYGILIGIKRSAVNVVHFDKTVERFETRASNLIKLSDITHIEVPLNNLQETINFTKQNRIDLPILPLEIGEIYTSNNTLKLLSGIE